MNQLQLRTDLKSMEEQFAMALPEHIKPSHVQRVVMTEVQKNPKILDCTKDSIPSLQSNPPDASSGIGENRNLFQRKMQDTGFL